MNQNNVVSLPAATNLGGSEFKVVTMTSAGVNLCASTAQFIGTLLRAQPVQEDGNYAGKAVSVQLAPASIHFVMIGASTAAVNAGDQLQIDTVNAGTLIPKAAGTAIAVALDSFTAAQGAIVRVIFINI